MEDEDGMSLTISPPLDLTACRRFIPFANLATVMRKYHRQCISEEG